VLVLRYLAITWLPINICVCRGGGRCNWWLRSAVAGKINIAGVCDYFGMVNGYFVTNDLRVPL
jgi:hypothetical protein